MPTVSSGHFGGAMRSGDFPWRLLVPSLPLMVALISLCRQFGRRMVLLYDPDTYMHIAAGQWMIQHWALPSHDPFSHSMPGAPWTVHEWLAEIVMAIVFNISGWGGLIVVTVVCFAITFAILTRYLLRHFEPLSALIIVGASVSVTVPHLLARPHILALPLLVLWCGANFSARDAGRRPPFWLLPVMVLWANLHGSFAFGIALSGYLALEAVLWPGPSGRLKEASRWGSFVVLTLVAAVLTPNGLAGLLGPILLINTPMMQAYIIEWMAPNFQELQPLELWLLGCLFVGFAFGFKLPLSRLLLMLGLFHMALTHARHADLLGLVLPLAIAASLGPQIAAKVLSDPPSKLAQVLARLAKPAPRQSVAAGLVLALAICSVTFLRPIPIVRGDEPTTPASALAAARRLGLSGPVFNSYGFGGFLIFNGVKTFVDGRVELYGNAFLKNYLLVQSGDDKAAAALLDKYHIGWTLLDPDQGAVAALDRSKQWHRVYSDKFAVIHARNEPLGSQN